MLGDLGGCLGGCNEGSTLTAAQRGLPHCCTEGTLLIQCVLMGPSAPCSVCQGEVFVLKNRMDDNWAWGTSQLSGNSGIIPLVIMEEVHGENHWYYGKVWFRPDVSKDRAIELLKTSKFQGGHFFAFCVPAATNSSWCCTPHPSPAPPLPTPPSPPPRSTLPPPLLTGGTVGTFIVRPSVSGYSMAVVTLNGVQRFLIEEMSSFHYFLSLGGRNYSRCVCACVRVCMCMCVCVYVCVWADHMILHPSLSIDDIIERYRMEDISAGVRLTEPLDVVSVMHRNSVERSEPVQGTVEARTMCKGV